MEPPPLGVVWMEPPPTEVEPRTMSFHMVLQPVKGNSHLGLNLHFVDAPPIRSKLLNDSAEFAFLYKTRTQ